MQCGPQCSVRDIVDMDERAHRVSATMKLELLTEREEEKCARDNAVKLLPRTEDIGCAGEDGGKVVLADEGLQVQVARGAGGGIRRARVERGVLPDIPGTTAIDLGSRDVDVFFEVRHFAESIVEAHVGHDIGLIPMVWMLPAFGNHALRGEVDHAGRFEVGDGVEQLGGVEIEIKLGEAKAGQFFRRPLPAIRQENLMRLGRSARAQHLPAFPQAVRDEACSGKRVASDDHQPLCITHWEEVSAGSSGIGAEPGRKRPCSKRRRRYQSSSTRLR